MLLKEFLEHGNIEQHVIVDRYYYSNSLEGYTVDDAEELMTKKYINSGATEDELFDNDNVEDEEERSNDKTYTVSYPIKHGKDAFSKTFDSLEKAFEFIKALKPEEISD